MRYRVIAPLVIACDQDGRAHHKYEGQVLPWLSKEQSAHFLAMGMVEALHDKAPDEATAEPAAPPQGSGSPAPPPPATPEPAAPGDATASPDPAARPLQVARKEVWVDYAVAAHHIDRTEAENMTLEQLKALPAAD